MILTNGLIQGGTSKLVLLPAKKPVSDEDVIVKTPVKSVRIMQPQQQAQAPPVRTGGNVVITPPQTQLQAIGVGQHTTVLNPPVYAPQKVTDEIIPIKQPIKVDTTIKGQLTTPEQINNLAPVVVTTPFYKNKWLILLAAILGVGTIVYNILKRK